MEASEFWEKIKQILSERGKSFDWLCEQAKVPVQIMRNRIYKSRIPGVEDTLKLFSVLDISIEDFYGIKKHKKQFENCDKSQIPVYDQIFSQDFSAENSGPAIIEGYITVPDDLKKYDGHLVATTVKGDSMEPSLFDGDAVLCDNLGFKEDGLYAIFFNGKSCIKRLQQGQGGVKIISDNRSYDSVFEKIPAPDSETQFRIIGKVHYVLHKLHR